MDATLDELPGEGEVQTITRVRVRHECEECGEPAHYKQTFLLPNYRSNPSSRAYGRDDCTWCEDASKYLCPAHLNRNSLEGYAQGSTFPASAQFAHLFLYWKERK
jgi:hypothetical protein